MSVSENYHSHCTFFFISNFVLPSSRSTIYTGSFFSSFPSLWNNRKTFLWRLSSGRTQSTCDVYTQVTHFRNRFQIACAVSWSIPGLYAISVKTDNNHLRGARHLPLSTLCVGLQAYHTPHVAWDSPSSTVNWCRCHPRWRIRTSQSSLFTAESRFHLGGSVEYVLDELECWFHHLHQHRSEANKYATAC